MISFPDSLRVLSPRAFLQGTGNGDALENVIPDELADGALCYVTETGVERLYRLDKSSMAAVLAPFVIATARGAAVPGRWVEVSGGGGGDLPLADGTLNAPSLAFLNSLTLGAYRIQNNLMGWVRDGFLGIEFGDNTIVNLDPISPATVRYLTRGHAPPVNGVSETAVFYCRLTYDAGDPQKAAFYVEIDSTQIDTYGPAIKVIHLGHGDAIYVALFSDGVAFEAASFEDGSRGVISTNQVAGHPNVVLFNALWEQNDIPNFGMYYADGAMGNALTAHKRTGAADGVTMFRIIENITSGGGRLRWAAYNDGSLLMQSLAATAGVTTRESPELRMSASGWDGAVAHDHKIIPKVVVTDPVTGRFELRFYAQTDAGAAVLLFAFTDQQLLDMQLGSIVNVASIQALNNLDIYAEGVLTIQLDPTLTEDDIGILLVARQGGAFSLKRVTQGPVDTPIAGSRMLLVPN